MQWSEINFAPSSKTLRHFALLCLLVFSALGSWQLLVRHNVLWSVVWGGLALGLGPLGLAKPQALRPVFVGWTIVAFPMGWLVSHALLALMYFGVFTPMSLLFKLIGRDALARRRHKTDTYWLPKPAVTDVRCYFRQF